MSVLEFILLDAHFCLSYEKLLQNSKQYYKKLLYHLIKNIFFSLYYVFKVLFLTFI